LLFASLVDLPALLCPQEVLDRLVSPLVSECGNS